MSARYGIGRLADSGDFPRLQRKVENLYDSYNYNSTTSNIVKCSEIIEENANVQRKLVDSLSDIASEGPIYSTTRSLIRSSLYPYTYSPLYYPCSYYPYYSYYYPYSAATTIAASAALRADLAVARKNAELSDLSYKYERDLTDLEYELNNTKLDKECLESRLEETKDQLENQRRRADSISLASQADLIDLKSKLNSAEYKLATLEPKAELANEFERRVRDLSHELRHVKTENALLADTNEFQSRIIKSRSSSPVIIHSRCASPIIVHSRCESPVVVCHRSRAASPVVCSRIRSYSPLARDNCSQVLRQDSLVSRYNNLFTRDRLNALDILRTYCDCNENNQRILFAAVQEAFSAAKRAFCDWKIRVRSTVALTHCGPETLEEAVQNYINRNVDLYDLPSLVLDVISALNRNPKISLPLGATYSIISSFIREACRLAWELSALAYPLDTAFALDGEVLDELKYRRSYDSEFSAPLVNHHIWPCLQQGTKVVVKGEACTRRGASLGSLSRSCSPLRSSYTRSRSPSPLARSRSRVRYISPIRCYY